MNFDQDEAGQRAARKSLEVLLAELVRLGDGIAEDELNRLKAKIKSALIMQQESSPARSGSIAARSCRCHSNRAAVTRCQPFGCSSRLTRRLGKNFAVNANLGWLNNLENDTTDYQSGSSFHLDWTLEYVRERTAFGKPIAEHQAVTFRLADMATGIEAAR